jgi:hypothetical protein
VGYDAGEFAMTFSPFATQQILAAGSMITTRAAEPSLDSRHLESRHRMFHEKIPDQVVGVDVVRRQTRNFVKIGAVGCFAVA